MNPLLTSWTTPFELPPFDQIAPEHFAPAFETALTKSRAEIDAIADQDAEATFENTIDALELSGKALTDIALVFFNLTGADTNEALQAVERDIAPVLAKHSTDTLFNAALFGRMEALMAQRQTIDLTPEQARVLERYHAMFVRAGARLTGADRERMAEINQRLAVITTQFSQNVLKDEADYELILDSEADLDGLPDFVRAAAAQAAEERGHAGKYAITLSRSIITPFLQFSKRRDLREIAFKAWASRGENGGETDNRDLITEIVALRAEKAGLLGFDTFAAYKLDDQMAKTPEAVRSLLTEVWEPARAQAKVECGALQAMVRAEGGNFDIEPWDWRYYSEKVRKAEHDLAEEEIKPYLQLDNIIAAAFDTANRLFGITFEERDGLNLYHPDVRAFEVRNANGDHVALFLADYFARPSKRSGAWMSAFRSQSKIGKVVHPIIVNVMNFAKSAEGQPTLLTFDDALTLFHEFGHALHGMLSDVIYPFVSGTSVARDFVELPSQLYEHWFSEAEVLRKYALHYQTGEPMPKDLLDRLLAAKNFNQGFQTVEYVASALVDLEVHLLSETDGFDPGAFEKKVLSEIGMPREIIMRHRTPHFAHIFSGDGYSSGYYSYMWSEVMDADAFDAFTETGDIFDKETARKLYEHIYSAGGSVDPAELYTAFRGRMPKIDALLRHRGLKSAA